MNNEILIEIALSVGAALLFMVATVFYFRRAAVAAQSARQVQIEDQSEEIQMLQDILEDAKSDLGMIAAALGVDTDPHQTWRFRLLEAAEEAGHVLRGKREAWGVMGLPAADLKELAATMADTAETASDGDDNYLLDLVLIHGVKDDRGTEVFGPQLCLRDHEYPEEGVLPLHSTPKTEDATHG